MSARRRAGRNVRAAGGAAADRLARGGARQASAAAGAVRAHSSTGRWTAAAAGFRRLPRRWRRVAGAACGVRDAACRTAAAGVGDWRRWPMDLRDPASPAVAVFAASHEREVLFHCFLQWLADRSLAIAQSRARGGGHAHRPDRRSRGRHGPDRQPRLEPAGRRAGRSVDRRAARSVQSARPGLGADRLLAARADRTAGSRRSSRRCAPRCAMPAACASTMPWA